MNGPRLEIDLEKIENNARMLIAYLVAKGISLTGITKSTLGSIEISHALMRAGIVDFGDSRIENIEKMHDANIDATMCLIRSPMLSQIERVVANADISFNTEIDVVRKLSIASVRLERLHGVVLMVELGDLREGVMPVDMEKFVGQILELPGVVLKGLGANLACRNGVVPDNNNMGELSNLADSLESTFGIHFDIVSGGNSANLEWAINCIDPGRINNLRLGESLFLGCETLHRSPIAGLHTDAFTLYAEVIESKIKPTLPWGTLAQNAFGELHLAKDQGDVAQSILAIGRQDVDSHDLSAPAGITIIDSSSDHLIVQCDRLLAVGTELAFQVNYSALTRTMTSPFVEKKYMFQK